MDIFTQIFGEPKRDYQEPDLSPTVQLHFLEFLETYDGDHNLYIVHCPIHTLYVGISQNGIKSRWFYQPDSHMHFIQKYSGTKDGGKWIGFSPIGKAVSANFPVSLQWRIELRHYRTANLHEMERFHIRELRPLFNKTYRDNLTNEEMQIRRSIEKGL